MLTAEDFETRWAAAERAPRGSGTVRLICVRVEEGVHETPGRAEVTVEDGLVGDRWVRGKRDLDAQITLMNVRVAELIGGPLDLPGDNFQVDLDLSEEALPVGTRLRLGEALLEVSPAPHTGCKKFRERFGLDALTWVNDHRDRRLRGMNCRVLEAGTVAVGDSGRRRLGRRPGVQQRARRGQVLAGLEQRLQAGEDHRPAAVDLAVPVRAQPGMDHRQPA